MNFIKIEHPDAFELLDENFIKGYENCEIHFCHAVVPDEPDEAQSLSMKTLKNALKMRYLAKENENPLINWKMSVNAAWYDFTSDEARLMYATEKWSRYIENIAIDFLGSLKLGAPVQSVSLEIQRLFGLAIGRFGTRWRLRTRDARIRTKKHVVRL